MFCLNYYPFQDYLQDADELKIKYHPADRSLEDFLKKYIDKSIVINIDEAFEDIDAQLFKGLFDKYKNFKLIVSFENKEALKKIQENEIPFFFSNFVTTIDQVYGLMKYHPTDMYICEELGFSLDKIGKILHENNIKVRVFPNICQSSFEDTPSIKTFFIRPNDIPTYSAFVDIFELISDQPRQKVLFKIYKQEKWIGRINEFIPSFKGDLDNKYILSNFGAIRSKCEKRCLYRPGSCNICDRFIDFANTLEKHKLIVKSVKKTN